MTRAGDVLWIVMLAAAAIWYSIGRSRERRRCICIVLTAELGPEQKIALLNRIDTRQWGGVGIKPLRPWPERLATAAPSEADHIVAELDKLGR